jgi:selenocysteine lyase/cysteine desulfurase
VLRSASDKSRQVFFFISCLLITPVFLSCHFVRPTLTPMQCQKHLFNLPPDIHYLNCASRGPFSIAVEKAGIQAIENTTAAIHQLAPDDFFEPGWKVRRLFAQLIDAPDPARVAFVPAVSYAMATVARNLPRKTGFQKGQRILLTEGEFPSDVYAWQRVAATHRLEITTIPMPSGPDAGSQWNADFLEAIDENTALVVCPHVHWMYGTRFDLERIAQRARQVGAWLVVDGTQSVGALPFSYQTIRPDLLVCASYKWLLGPYSLGVAYFGEAFDDGEPLEETWMGRAESNQFHRLTDYQATYREKAFRYNVGEQSNFVQMPMLKAALEQLLSWTPAAIQRYCAALLRDVQDELREAGYFLEAEGQRASHLVGMQLPAGKDVMAVQKALAEANVYVSARGQGIRVSPHLYNTPEDMQALLRALRRA